MNARARELVHMLSNDLQAVLGWLELEDYSQALHYVKESVKTLHCLRTEIHSAVEHDHQKRHYKNRGPKLPGGHYGD